MKKRIVLTICTIIIIMVVVLLYLNRTVATINLDINPSIKILLKRNNKVKDIIALNDDAKKVVNNKLIGSSFDVVIDDLVTNLIEKDYVRPENAFVLISSEGSLSNKKIDKILRDSFDDKKINIEIIFIENITKEDKKIAKKYNITESKASYINAISKDKNIDASTLVNKSINEIKETKDTGNYCDKDYTLEYGRCVKEIGKTEAVMGKICKEGYYEYEGKCYLETPILEKDNYVCREEYELVGNECFRKEEIKALGNYKCEIGKLVKRDEAYREIRDQGDRDEMLCADESTGQKPIERCLAQEHIIVDGKCGMGPKPLLPTPTGCTPEDTNINGGCYDFNHKDEYVCPTSGIYDTDDMICPETITYTKATLINYYCENGYKLKDNMCIKEEKEEAQKERYCPDNYTLVNNDRCINLNKVSNYVDGYVCKEENSKVDGKECILLEIKDVKR